MSSCGAQREAGRQLSGWAVVGEGCAEAPVLHSLQQPAAQHPAGPLPGAAAPQAS